MRTFSYYEDAREISPVEKFIITLPARERVQVLRKLRFYTEIPSLQMPPYREFTGYRVRFGKLRPLPFRIFVHQYAPHQWVLLHAFRKQSDETPLREINRA